MDTNPTMGHGTAPGSARGPHAVLGGPPNTTIASMSGGLNLIGLMRKPGIPEFLEFMVSWFPDESWPSGLGRIWQATG
jgi:hypothetical protein